MNSAQGVWAALLAVVTIAAVTADAAAQSPQRVPGSWIASDDKFGIVFEKGDLTYAFLYASCEPARNRAQLDWEIDSRYFGKSPKNNPPIAMRYGGGRGAAPPVLTASGIAENEMDGGWLASFSIDATILQYWLGAERLEMTVGVRTRRGFEPRKTYILPDDNRREALTTAARMCFEDQPANSR